MFYMRWLLATIIALVVCAAGFALVQYLMKGNADAVMAASVSSIVTSIVTLFVLFPHKKKK